MVKDHRDKIRYARDLADRISIPKDLPPVDSSKSAAAWSSFRSAFVAEVLVALRYGSDWMMVLTTLLNRFMASPSLQQHNAGHGRLLGFIKTATNDTRLHEFSLLHADVLFFKMDMSFEGAVKSSVSTDWDEMRSRIASFDSIILSQSLVAAFVKMKSDEHTISETVWHNPIDRMKLFERFYECLTHDIGDPARGAANAKEFNVLWSRREAQVVAGNVPASQLDICVFAREAQPAASSRQHAVLDQCASDLLDQCASDPKAELAAQPAESSRRPAVLDQCASNLLDQCASNLLDQCASDPKVECPHWHWLETEARLSVLPQVHRPVSLDEQLPKSICNPSSLAAAMPPSVPGQVSANPCADTRHPASASTPPATVDTSDLQVPALPEMGPSSSLVSILESVLLNESAPTPAVSRLSNPRPTADTLTSANTPPSDAPLLPVSDKDSHPQFPVGSPAHPRKDATMQDHFRTAAAARLPGAPGLASLPRPPNLWLSASRNGDPIRPHRSILDPEAPAFAPAPSPTSGLHQWQGPTQWVHPCHRTATVTEACPLAPDARPTVVTAVIADRSHVLLLRRRLPQGGSVLVLPATRVGAATSEMLSLEKACAEQIGRFPDAFNDVSSHYHHDLRQGPYRHCIFVCDKPLVNMRHLLYDMMQNRDASIAVTFPEAALVPWSSLHLVDTDLDAPARSALAACRPLICTTTPTRVCLPVCPVAPRLKPTIPATRLKLGSAAILPTATDPTGIAPDNRIVRSVPMEAPRDRLIPKGYDANSVAVVVTRLTLNGAQILVQRRDGSLRIPSVEPGPSESVILSAKR